MTRAPGHLLAVLLPMLWLNPVLSSEPTGPSRIGQEAAAPNSMEAAPTASVPEPIVPPPKRTLRLILDWYPGPQHASIFLAKALGYLDRQDIELDIVAPADPSVPSKLVAASRADLALTRQPHLHLEVDRGQPLIRVATLIDSPLALLTVRDDSGITEIAQLADKTIGFAVKDALRPGLATLLEQAGLTLEGVTPENVDFNMVQALVEQRVDALYGAQRPMLTEQLRRAGIRSHSFLIEEHGLPPHDGLVLIANRNKLQRQREDIQHLVSAIERASLWLVNHPEQAWQRLIAFEPGLDTPANRRAWPELIRRFSLSPAALDSHRYARFEAFLMERGDITTHHPASRLAVDIYAP